MDKDEKFKVYIVADAYRWHELSVYPDIFEKWIQLMMEESREKTFTFMTKLMTENEYTREIKILSAMNRKEQKQMKNTKPVKKTELKILNDENQADIIEFPGKKND